MKTADKVAAHELYLYAVNSEPLYRRQGLPIIENLRRKVKRGTYDPAKAANLYYYLADSAAREYAKEYGGTFSELFSVPTRKLAASELFEHYRSEFESMRTNPRRRRINVHREQEKAYGRGVHIDIDVNSHNLPGKGRNAFRANPHRPRKGVEPPALKRWRLAQKRGRIMKPRTFREIEREAERRYRSKARAKRVAGAAYWRTAEAKYKAHEQRVRHNPVQYFVQYRIGNHWRTLAAFTHKAQAVDYGRAIKRRHRGRTFRVWWK